MYALYNKKINDIKYRYSPVITAYTIAVV